MPFIIKDSPLSKVDLNLLIVLDVLLRERSVGRTAERLNLTSPAVSHSLKRLRLLFDNELLVRDGRKMVLTKRGQSLSETLPAVLAQVEHILTEPEPFDPATSIRSFRLAAPDFISPLLPHLLTATAKEAPSVSVQLIAYAPTEQVDMGQGQIDALIAPSFRKSDEMRGEVLGTWDWKVFGRKGHPAFKTWSIESWAAFPHLLVSASSPSGRNPIDRAATEKGVTRNIGAIVPQFSMAAPILVGTDMLLTVPSIAMNDIAPAFGLEARESPLDLKPLELSLFTSSLRGDQPDVRWLHDHVLRAASKLGPSP